jgi:hypothetical protein
LVEKDVKYKEIEMAIADPTDDGNLVLSKPEKLEQDEANAANDVNENIGPTEAIAGFLFSLPIVTSKVSPWGLGISLGWGASNFSQATMAVARTMRITANSHSYNSSNSARKGSNI